MDKNFTIAIDILGNDKGPEVMIDGAILALNEFNNIHLSLIGPKDLIESKLKEANIDQTRVDIIDANDTITNFDNPMSAIFTKPNASIIQTMKACSSNDNIGMITSGSSGALLMCSFRFLMDENKTRPCLCSVLPHQKNGYTCLVDTGATIDCTSGQLHEFAKLGSSFMKRLYKIESPRVALLSNGAEETKGNHLVKETFPLLKEDSTINFVGNIEGNNCFKGDVDVLVCDGFAGNQILKSTEGTAKRLIKDIIVYSKKNNRPEFLEVAQYLMNLYDFSNLGGAFILGAKKDIVKLHGHCEAQGVVSACKILLNMVSDNAIF